MRQYDRPTLLSREKSTCEKPQACYYSPSVATLPHGGIDQGPMHQVAQGRGTKTPIERSFRPTGAQPNAPAVTQDTGFNKN